MPHLHAAVWLQLGKNRLLSGQLIMDFDYSHFVLLSAVLSPTGGPAERPAPVIVSLSGLIEPNGNGCCQSSFSSSVYMLIHQRDIHYCITKTSPDMLCPSFCLSHSLSYTNKYCVFIMIKSEDLSGPQIQQGLEMPLGIN